MLKHLRTRAPIIAGLILLFIAVFIGQWFGLYLQLPGIDKVFHVTGGIIAAWFVLTLFQKEVGHMAAWKQAAIFIGITTLIGVVWEFAEYISNFTRATHPLLYHYFHGGDLADTLGDLFSDIIGAALLTLWALRKEGTL